MAKAESKELTKPSNELVAISKDLPAYLTGGEATGIEHLGKDDFNIPQLVLLQALSPQVETYRGTAIPGEYWHTGLVKSLQQEVRSVVCVARKRTILWRPKNDQGGGILAISNDSIHWDRGGNTKFSVILKGKKEPVIWDTKSNVIESGLTDFGSSTQIPGDTESPPAAVEYFEYIHYLLDHINASPVVQRISKTGLKTAKDLNAYFLLQRKPIYTHALRWFVENKSSNEGTWTIPRFEPIGYVPENIFNITKKMHEQYKDIELNIEQDKETENVVVKGTEAF